MFFFFQTEGGIRYLVRSRGLGEVYKRQALTRDSGIEVRTADTVAIGAGGTASASVLDATGSVSYTHLTLPTSDLA